jgi:hypothetical protein
MRKTWKNTIGFLSPEKAKFCEHVIKEHVTQDSVCLEIGTYCGKSTLHLIEYGNPKKIITIDNYTELQSTAGLPDVFEENILDIPTAKISNPKAYTFETKITNIRLHLYRWWTYLRTKSCRLRMGISIL